MPDIVIEQSIWSRQGGPPDLLARSPGFHDDWLPEVRRLVTAFGERPPGVACPRAVFAQPLGREAVAVVQVGDQPGDNGTPSLGFHVLVLPRPVYTQRLGDPFFLAEQFAPGWHLRGDLPPLTLADDAQPRRTVAQVQRVLQRVKAAALPEGADPHDEEAAHQRAVANAESPALLGGVQVLVDGGKLVFERPEPDPGLIAGLWALLPNTSRGELWPASFAFDNALRFDALVVPRLRPADYPGYTGEEQAADYPPGRYELQLQTAAEAGDQHELDALFARRSWNDTWRLAVALLVVISALVVGMNLISRPPEPVKVENPADRPALTAGQKAMRASTAARVVTTAPADPFGSAALLIGGHHYITRGLDREPQPQARAEQP